MFFDEFAGDFHPTFGEELSQQLYEKGGIGTGIKQFAKHGFQLIVGMKDLQMKVVGDRVYAKIDFVTPTSWSFPVDIYWTADAKSDISVIHRSDIKGKSVDINWADNFPVDKVLPHIRPYRIDKRGKNGLEFSVEYYYHLFPDITFEFKFSAQLNELDIDKVNTCISDFRNSWNQAKKGKEIHYMSQIEKNDENSYVVVADFGAKNSIRIVTDFLKTVKPQFDNLKLEKVVIS
jgi:hypothetical protein